MNAITMRYKPGVCISFLSFVGIDIVKFIDIEGNKINITMALVNTLWPRE